MARFWLGLILVFAFGVRMWRLSIPQEYYFDEVYHAFTAEAYARDDPRGYEWWHQAPEGVAYEWLHPPFSKLLMGMSIFWLGDNSFAWRLPSAVFGVMVIAAVYWFSKVVSGDRRVGTLAAVMASLDGLLLTQSRIAMNDIFVTFFVVVALGFYWRFGQLNKKDRSQGWGYLVAAGFMAGLAMASKWSGVYVLLPVAIWEFGLSKSSGLSWKNWAARWLGSGLLVIAAGLLVAGLWPMSKVASVGVGVVVTGLVVGLVGSMVGYRRLVWMVSVFGLVPIIVYLWSFGQFWLQERPDNWDTFVNLHKQIWWYQTNLDATHPYQSKPWQWITNLKPVWFYVNWQEKTTANIYALANPAIAWLGLLAMGVNLVWKRWQKQMGVVFVVICYLSVWVPWVASPRIMFFYHYAPAIPFLATALGWVVVRIWDKGGWSRVVARIIVATVVANFVYFYPHWTGLPIPKEWVEQYYWFESWR